MNKENTSPFATSLIDLFDKETIDPLIADWAKTIVMACIRNTQLEDLHAGIFPVSKTGDYEDVFITDAEGNSFPFSKLSRINDDEMKDLMKESVDRMYASLMVMQGYTKNEEARATLGLARIMAKEWDAPDGQFLRKKMQNEQKLTTK